MIYVVPIVGMLCGSTISGIVVSVTYVLKELKSVNRFNVFFVKADLSMTSFSDNRDKVETYLAFGASRLEACKPIATEALRLALTPTINQMRYVSVHFTRFLPTDRGTQCARDNCDSRYDDRGHSWRLISRPSSETPDGYHVHDILVYGPSFNRHHRSNACYGGRW